MRAVAEKDREQILSIYSDAEALKFQASRTISTIDEADDLIVNFTNGFERRLFIRWCIADKLNDEIVAMKNVERREYLGANHNFEYDNDVVKTIKVTGEVVQDVIEYLVNT